MNPDIKEQWLTALRSGEYPKTKHSLRRVDAGLHPTGYCCLGVLTDLAAKDPETHVTWGKGEKGCEKAIYGKTSDEDYLIPAVSRWAGLMTHVNRPSLPIEANARMLDMQPNIGIKLNLRRAQYLDELNDSDFTFDQIAALIEEFGLRESNQPSTT